jgi:catalase (peroxidase I)
MRILAHCTIAGARIRFGPEGTWPLNVELDRALRLLEPIKEKFGEDLSWADLIVLAGNTALEVAGSRKLTFCGGRTDAANGEGSQYLKSRVTGNSSDEVVIFKDTMMVHHRPIFPRPLVGRHIHPGSATS